MKNPFAAALLMAQVMAEALREHAYRKMGMPLPQSRSRSRTPGKDNPAGSKALRRYYKAKTGLRGTYEEAKEFYKNRGVE